MHRTSPTQDDPLSFSFIQVLWDGLFKKKKDLCLTNKPPATDCKTAWYNWLPPDLLSLKQPRVDSLLPITMRCEEYHHQMRGPVCSLGHRLRGSSTSEGRARGTSTSECFSRSPILKIEFSGEAKVWYPATSKLNPSVTGSWGNRS